MASLYLATTHVLFPDLSRQGPGSSLAASVADALMECDDVVTLRIDAKGSTVYRSDVPLGAIDVAVAAAVAPALTVAESLAVDLRLLHVVIEADDDTVPFTARRVVHEVLEPAIPPR